MTVEGAYVLSHVGEIANSTSTAVQLDGYRALTIKPETFDSRRLL